MSGSRSLEPSNPTLIDLRAMLIDLDGVLWVGDRELPGVVPFFETLDRLGIKYILVSNNATRRADYPVERMRRLGVTISPSQVLTSADATPRWLRSAYPQFKRVYVVGEAALCDALTEAGYELVLEHADAVVMGLDRQLTYAKIERAALEIRAGATFVATNTDSTLPTERGLAPGAGSLVAALVVATDVKPIVIGKPGTPMFELAMQMAGTSPSETAMLGDRLDTDIDGAAALGLRTIMVLTGVSNQAQAEQNTPQPDLIMPDLPALTRALAHSY